MTPVIRSGCHGNRQCASSIQVGLSCAWTPPSVLAQDLCCACQRRRFTPSVVSSFSPLDGRHGMRLRSDSTFVTETSKLFLLGAICKCLSQHSERGLAVLLMSTVNRSTNIWYLLETFQSLLKQHFFCSLVPLASRILNPFKWESTGPWEPMLSVANDRDSTGLTQWKGFVGRISYLG